MRQSRWMNLFSEYGFEAKYHLGKANVVVESWIRKKSEAKNKFWIDVAWLGPTSVKRDREWFKLVRQGSDLQLERCKDLGYGRGRSSMKKNMASCGSKYLACAEMEVEYKGSSRLLLRPEIPEWKWEKITKDVISKLPSLSNGYDAIGC
ncbi:hypothetical protein Tco_0900780, partial [Tanacetum coccineum]